RLLPQEPRRGGRSRVAQGCRRRLEPEDQGLPGVVVPPGLSRQGDADLQPQGAHPAGLAAQWPVPPRNRVPGADQQPQGGICEGGEVVAGGGGLSFLCPRSPIGRGSRLKIDSVRVRVPSGAPKAQVSEFLTGLLKISSPVYSRNWVGSHSG